MVDPLDIRVESEIEREIEAEMAIEEGQASSASLVLPLFKVRRDRPHSSFVHLFCYRPKP